MTIFFQQSGKRGEADFQKTLADPNGNLRLFTSPLLAENYGFGAKPTSFGHLTDDMRFQIWGVPSGARRVMDLMRPGDIVLLIGQLSPKALEYGRFYYAGRVVHVQPEEDPQLSRHLWGEGGFPLIFFIQGRLVDYTWANFQEDFGFSKAYYEAGTIKRVLQSRVFASRYKTEDSFAEFLGMHHHASDLSQLDVRSGPVFELSRGGGGLGFSESKNIYQPPALDFESEGERILREHYEIERSSVLVARFKSTLKSFACAICHFDFEETYGRMGRGYIEAHHVRPLPGGRRVTTLTDFLAVCANCHRVLHRNWPHHDISSLRACFRPVPGSSRSADEGEAPTLANIQRIEE